jgi:hypothetical protein
VSCHAKSTTWYKTPHYTDHPNLQVLGPRYSLWRCALNHCQFLSFPHLRLTAFHHSCPAFYKAQSGPDSGRRLQLEGRGQVPWQNHHGPFIFLLNPHKNNCNLTWLSNNVP